MLSIITAHSSKVVPNKGNSSFWRFMIRNRTNRQVALVGIGAIIIQFSVFKWLYPFPDFISDSYFYIYAAQHNLNISIIPIGYSKFLALFHLLSHSDLGLIAFQYFFLQAATLFFLFTILFLYSPKRTNRIILFIFLLCNPLLLYIGNHVSNDPIFVALSLLWFTQLLWIISRPSIYQIALQAVLLFLCVSIGDNAYYYLLIACSAFCLSISKPWLKTSGIALSLLAVLPLAFYVRHETFKIDATSRSSIRTGWMLGNTALYIRRSINVDTLELPAETRELDRMVTNYFKSSDRTKMNADLSGYVTTFFIDNWQGPLQKYMRTHIIDHNPAGLASAAHASAVFSRYGNWLIWHYPLSFAQYYMIPNMRNYFLPPLEDLESYNHGNDEVFPEAQDWFDYQTPNVTSISANVQGKILLSTSFIFLIIQVFFVGGVAWWLLAIGFHATNPLFTRLLILNVIFWLAHLSVSIVNSPIVMRYQVFLLITTCPFALLLIEHLDHNEMHSPKTFKPLVGINRAINNKVL